MKRNSPTLTFVLCFCAALASHAAGPSGGELQPPFRIQADGQPIDTDIGHAAPLYADFDGDGTPDLLVGQFRDGKLKIYRNLGTATAPKFGAFAWFQAGGADGKVPSG
jgi:hypothetical protein